MKKFLIALSVALTTFAAVTPADAWVGVGPGRRGVGVGRPGAYGVGGFGRVGVPGRPVATPRVRATPFRPFVGPVVR